MSVQRPRVSIASLSVSMDCLVLLSSAVLPVSMDGQKAFVFLSSALGGSSTDAVLVSTSKVHSPSHIHSRLSAAEMANRVNVSVNVSADLL